ncbi:MAG: peptide-methionine (S)-S-oxide reductase [Anaerolineae bacterium]|nr:peptide-methionine (S)-S-oxide reductase [Anaerolineae bacterium]
MVRTRVGYTGGKKLNPTYYSLGDHTETLQIDYDPTVITYDELLAIFWSSHNPTRRTWSQQYKAAIFVHNERQQRQAERSKSAISEEKTGRFFNRKIHTEIIPASTFYLAENYHHKYLLQHSPQIWAEIREIYGKPSDWIDSTAAARLNAYVGGYGSSIQLEEEIKALGLSAAGQKQLWKLVRRFGK